MLYAKQAILIICILFYFLSHNKGSGNVFATQSGATQKETKQAIHAKIQSGAVQNGGKENRGNTGVSQVPRCDQECKVEAIISVGIREEIASSLVIHCKNQDIEVINCIKLGASISVAESGGGRQCNKNGCFGVLAKVEYKTKDDGVKDWVIRFGKHWLNQRNPDSFYSNSPNWKPITKYCLSEKSSGLPYCKNGHRIAWSVYNKLEKKF